LIAIDPVTIENTAIALSSDEAARLAAFISGKPYPAASRRHAGATLGQVITSEG
jgi:hypothetical protein